MKPETQILKYQKEIKTLKNERNVIMHELIKEDCRERDQLTRDKEIKEMEIERCYDKIEELLVQI